ncbi:LIM domain kinase 1-like isoform X2 [Apostichopus japonicus]|uniref:LIM domain kinase 1-like isoform X2 n=1 Tax=Stichopus japonicus TaxID=307972 RepID=UPI003AB36889
MTCVAGDHKFHPDCFICVKCRCYIGDGESYALVERSKLYCGKCYQDIVINRPRKPGKKRKKKHTVQLLRIPSTPEGQKSILVEIAKYTAFPTSPVKQCDAVVDTRSLCVVGVEEASDALDIAIGSRVLEVNGMPVESSNLTELAAILRTTKDDLSITLEHDPEVSPELGKENSTLSLTAAQNNNKSGFQLKSPLRKKRDGMFISPSNPDLTSFLGNELRIDRVGTLPNKKKPSTDEDIGTSVFNRTMSLKSQRNQQIFRSSDLVRGETLGKGFFGQAVKVTHRKTGEVMVLKELVRCNDDAQRTFLQEAKVLRSLHHKNVLKFIGVVYKDKKLSIITEYLSGGALGRIIVDHSVPLSWCKRVLIAKDISSGLEYLHSMKIIHRDLNSQNCLLKEDGTVVVADFGLARITVEDKSNPRLPVIQDLKKPGHRKKRYTVVGNPFWMAPEMMKGYIYDEKVDIFSFSLIICELIGRIDADPDLMPRLSNFGLNVNLFRKLYCSDCPEVFFQIAVKGSNLDSDSRPSSYTICKWLTSLSLYFEHGAPLLDELKPMNVSPTIDASPETEAPA